MKITGYILLALSSFFIIQSSYELFVLTSLGGPQNIFFSILHTWPGWLIILFFISWLAYYLYLLFSVVAMVIKKFSKKYKGIKYTKDLRNSFYVIFAHFIISMTYQYWAVALFTKE